MQTGIYINKWGDCVVVTEVVFGLGIGRNVRNGIHIILTESDVDEEKTAEFRAGEPYHMTRIPQHLKRSIVLAYLPMKDDDYHNAIKKSAQELCQQQRFLAEYIGSSSKVVWR